MFSIFKKWLEGREKVFNREFFEKAVAFTLKMEGGYTKDTGGHTNFGISAKAHNLTREQIMDLTEDKAKEIYYDEYWVKGGCSEMPYPVAVAHFDACVNLGVKKAIRIIQGCCGLKKDGELGPLTLKAVQVKNPRQLALDIILFREAFYRKLAGFDKYRSYLRGWLNRTTALRLKLGEMALKQ